MARALYLSHTGMTEPLGQSQVLPYLRGLVRAGWEIELVAFEPASTARDEIEALVRALHQDGIRYHWTRRSPSHAFAVKLAEAAEGLLRATARALASRPRIIHARSYLPAAVARLCAALTPGARFLFDCRGLLGDEYLDAGRLARDSPRYRLIKAAERRLFAGADAVVVLTERLRLWLRGQSQLVRNQTPIEVIPCCVDLGRFHAASAVDRAAARARLAAGDRFVLAYSGSLGSWYLEEEMAALYAALRRHRPSRFAVFSRSSTARLEAALAARGVPTDELVSLPVPPSEMPRMLAGADAAVSFIAPCFSKMASSPTKVAEYLALGLPVVMNRGVGDGDDLIRDVPAIIDAGTLLPGEIERAAAALASGDRSAIAGPARRAAADYFSLETVGVARYRRLYERLAG